MFAIQPRGLSVEGEVSLEFAIPELNGSREYIENDDFEYVVILGYNAELEVIEPIGVGRINNGKIIGAGKMPVNSMDFFGYALIDPEFNDLLRDIAEGNQPLRRLLTELQ